MANYWQDPPKNSTAGGDISVKFNEGTVSVDTYNAVYFCGFDCDKVGSDYNECTYYQTYVRFMMPFPVISGVSYAGITFRAANANFTVEAERIIGHPINVYTYDGDTFSYILSSGDLSMDGWTLAGEWENIPDIYDTINSTGSYWLPMFDVTSEFLTALNGSMPYFEVRLRPLYTTPYTYNYYNYPGYDQESWVSFYGACVGTAAWCASPPGFTAPYCVPTPWLKIVHGGGEQEIPGEEAPESIACISSDYKSQSALVGTTKGSLWRTWDYGANWANIYEVASGVA
jgi:hypothetical protein